LKLRSGEDRRRAVADRRRKEYCLDEDDVSAEKAAEEKGTWFSQAHEDEERQARAEA
jgi:hypothetical protein